ncbi:MAG: thermonuclease family protein [Burkholderiaceae bacterium]|nr:thermonuclease family protein [Burkholderiaceae bacterium]
MSDFIQAALILAMVASPPTQAAKVIGIADGDTLTVLENKKPVKIRLANIDAPERAQAFGNRSRQSLSDLCFHTDARYDVQDKDRYGRLVATVYCDDINVNRKQVELGFAWVYPKYNKDHLIPALQDQAFSAGRGLWADSHPVPPWEWRKQNREKAN